jgi:hypothetical protein
VTTTGKIASAEEARLRYLEKIISAIFEQGDVAFRFAIVAFPLSWRSAFVYALITLSPHPTPLISLLLQTKGKVVFDRTVDRAVEAIFRAFSTVESRSNFSLP